MYVCPYDTAAFAAYSCVFLAFLCIVLLQPLVARLYVLYVAIQLLRFNIKSIVLMRNGETVAFLTFPSKC